MNDKKRRLAIDMDEVLADTHAKFLTLFNRDFGIPLDLKQKPGTEIFENMPKEIGDHWKKYVNEPGFFRDVPVMRGALNIVPELNKKYDLFIVSAAMEFKNSFLDKYSWLEEHFPFIPWTNILFTGRKIIVSDVLIDDRAKNFSEHIERPLLFTSPHNVLLEEYERVNSWEEVGEKLL
ncbi:5' nucleotidase, NT5C type [Olivibacter sitiensis]|uniref:5' nucleotidase, NT5C type n=1 Tax=Olivibacter sitiensis TaxID=376470 RepID=UPI0003F62E4C|nr:5'-3'-deoxyribonucleotidase [Olivibacter sitiensis]